MGSCEGQSEFNEQKKKKSIKKMNETKICFFKKTNKIDKSLARLLRKRREK